MAAEIRTIRNASVLLDKTYNALLKMFETIAEGDLRPELIEAASSLLDLYISIEDDGGF